MINSADDHDIIDGWGSYPEDLQTSPVFSTIGSKGYWWFLLFQSTSTSHSRSRILDAGPC
jgi:hypothetical protein